MSGENSDIVREWKLKDGEGEIQLLKSGMLMVNVVVDWEEWTTEGFEELVAELGVIKDQANSEYLKLGEEEEEEFEEPDVEGDAITCSVCSGPAESIGSLGALTYFRCRHCGNQWGSQMLGSDLIHKGE